MTISPNEGRKFYRKVNMSYVFVGLTDPRKVNGANMVKIPRTFSKLIVLTLNVYYTALLPIQFHINKSKKVMCLKY